MDRGPFGGGAGREDRGGRANGDPAACDATNEHQIQGDASGP